jgi:hypothetical protein
VNEYERDIMQSLLKSRGLVVPDENKEGMVDVYETFIDTLQTRGVISKTTVIDTDYLLDIADITIKELNKLEGI